MNRQKMKKFVSIKGVIDNLRQSVNTPSPTGGSGATGMFWILPNMCTTVDIH